MLFSILIHDQLTFVHYCWNISKYILPGSHTAHSVFDCHKHNVVEHLKPRPLIIDHIYWLYLNLYYRGHTQLTPSLIFTNTLNHSDIILYKPCQGHSSSSEKRQAVPPSTFQNQINLFSSIHLIFSVCTYLQKWWVFMSDFTCFHTFNQFPSKCPKNSCC